MISSISSATPTVPATRAATSQTQPGNTSESSHEAEDAQRTHAGSDAEAKRDTGADTRELATTDREVRAHEAAHLAAAGGLAQGGASFDTVRGPDGRPYAIGGEVSIDVSPGRTPEETIAKAQQIRSAALAPADPSAQDYRVAAQAAQMAQQAQQALATQRGTQQETQQPSPPPSAEASSEYASGRIAQALSGLQAATAVGDQVNIFA